MKLASEIIDYRAGLELISNDVLNLIYKNLSDHVGVIHWKVLHIIKVT